MGLDTYPERSDRSIAAAGYGTVEFTLPGFAEFVREAAG